MNKQAREWFDRTYETGLPFPVFLIEVGDEDIMRMTGGKVSYSDISDILSQYNFSNKPSHEDFLEEKARIRPLLVDALKALFPDVSAAYSFGRVRGDIDVCLISDKLESSEAVRILRSNQKVMRRFPIVDWESIPYFLSRNNYEFYQRILKSRTKALGLKNSKELPANEISYIRQTIGSVELLWELPL